MRVYNNFDLTNYNSYRLKSICKTAYFPENEKDVIALYKSNKIFILLGSGHNIILSKVYYDRDFIILNGNYNSIEVDKSSNTVSLESGVFTKDLCLVCEENSLSGAEFLYDIPSSIGGAVVMNAGTKEGETKNILYKVRYFDLEDNLVKEKMNEEIEFSYRDSFFQKNKNKIILKAWFKLKPGNKLNIRQVMTDSKLRRWSKQPREYPNSGSVFKRPPSKFVGPMIDELGLKGFTIGGAQISKKHSGFIVNLGNATGNDILNLIKYIQTKVNEKHNIHLEIEQRII